MGEPLAKRRKISLACQTCRERKIRCDGERPACGSCRRGRRIPILPCAYMPTATGMMTSDMSVQSMAERLEKLEKELVAATSNGKSRSSNMPGRSDRSVAEEVAVGNHEQGQGERSQENFYESGSREEDTTHAGQRSESEPSWKPLVPPCENREQIDQSSNKHFSTTAGAPNPHLLMSEDIPSYQSSSSPEDSRPMSFAPSIAAVVSPSATTFSRTSRTESDIQYYGGSSSTQFMKDMNKTLSTNVGIDDNLSYSASAAHQGLFGIIVPNGKSYPLVTDSQPGRDKSVFEMENFVLPARHLCDHLMHCYWMHIHPLFPYIHQPTFMKAYNMLWEPSPDYTNLREDTDVGLGNSSDAGPQSQVFYCALNVMLALGVYYSEIPASSRKNAMAMFIKRHGNLLVVDMMDKGTVALVQTLLLSAHYWHSYPQKCWNSLGVAYRIAQGLGLHVGKGASKVNRLATEMRRRVWHGVIMLDTGSSMALGRPVVQAFSVPFPAAIDDEWLESDMAEKPSQNSLPTMAFYVQALKLNRILGHILRALYEPDYFTDDDDAPKVSSDYMRSFVDMEAVLKLEREMTTFLRDLPDELRWDRRGFDARAALEHVPSWIEPQKSILQARFLDIQILLYRNVFTKLCQRSQITAQNSRNHDIAEDEELTMQTFFATRCSMMCIAAAQKIIPIAHDSLKFQAMDTWWYNMLYTHTAGLVITMARICHPLHENLDIASLDDSWRMCQQTLLDMSFHGDGPRKCLDSIQVIREQIEKWETTMSSRKDPKRTTTRAQMENQTRGDVTSGQESSSVFGGEGVDAADEMMPSNGVEEWRDMETENSFWTVDLGEWWNNPACDFL